MIRPARRSLNLGGCIILGLLAGCAQRPAIQVRVLSFNIHHGVGMDSKLDLSRTLEAIKAARPDLVALQEVDRRTNRSKNIDQLQVLADGTGLRPIFGKTIDWDGGEYGIAILSRFPVEYQRVHPLPYKKEKRALMEVGVRVGASRVGSHADGRELVFFNTDLDDDKDDAERFGSVDVFGRSVSDLESSTPAGRRGLNVPIIFAGDLFVTPEHAVMQRLRSTLLDSAEAGHELNPLTVVAANPTKRIDYILYSKIPGLRCIEYHVIHDPLTAQHRPVLAVFEIRSRDHW